MLRRRRDRSSVRVVVGERRYRGDAGHVLLLPPAYVGDGSTPGVIYCPGRGASHRVVTEERYARIPMAIARAGFPVLSATLGGTRTWGNDAAVDGIDAAVTFLVSRYRARPDGVLLVAGSMGVLGALNWAARHRTRALAIAATLPIVDLADVHDHDRGGFALEIEAAHGGPGRYVKHVASHNPMRCVSTLAGLPFRAWYATNDPIAHPAALEAFVDAIGPPASAVSLGPIGHTGGRVGPDEVVHHLRSNSR